MPANPDILKSAIEVLNELLEKSPEGANALFNHRVPVTKDIADHPSIQVQVTGDKAKLGFIGLLNGILEPQTGKRVAMIIDNDKVVGFTEYRVPKATPSHEDPIKH